MKVAQTIVLILASVLSLTFVGLTTAGMLVAEKKVERPQGSNTNGFFEELSLSQEMGGDYYSNQMAEQQKRSANQVLVTWLFGLIFIVLGIVVDRWQQAISTSLGGAGLMLMMLGGVTGYFVFETESSKLLIWLLTAVLCVLGLLLLSLTRKLPENVYSKMIPGPAQQTNLPQTIPVPSQPNPQPIPGQSAPTIAVPVDRNPASSD